MKFLVDGIKNIKLAVNNRLKIKLIINIDDAMGSESFLYIFPYFLQY